MDNAPSHNQAGCCCHRAETANASRHARHRAARVTLTGLPGIAVALSCAAVASSALLLVFALGPTRLSQHAHADLSALPLAIVALAYVLHQPLRRPSTSAIVKSTLLAAAFLLWAAYQLNPDAPLAVNDLAIALFVLDIALVIGSDIRHAIHQTPR